MGNMSEALIYYHDQNIVNILDRLIDYGVSTVIIADSEDWEKIEYIKVSATRKNVLILQEKEFFDLIKKENTYYISGAVAAIYSSDTEKSYKVFKTIRKHIDINLKIFHISRGNMEFTKINKHISELVEGPILLESRLL